MKKLLCILVLFSYFLMQSAYVDHALSDIHHMHAHYERLKKYNKWYIKDLYYAIKPSITQVYSVLTGVPQAALFAVIGHHTHEQQDASVRIVHSDTLCESEKIYITQRSRNTHKALESFLDRSIDKEKQPRIACCFSGGGFRAMILTLGFLVAAQDSGLLDCVTYMSGLSGSTWVMAPWLATKKDLHEWRDTLGQKTAKGIRHLKRHFDRKQIVKQLLTKVWFKQSVSAMDIYGPLLANTLLTEFKDTKLQVTISDTHEHIMQGRYPLPIYTCIATNIEPYEWFEVTPFELGSNALGAYVPLWAYGRAFKDGKSMNYAPEQSLAYFMGIFGSAFEVDIEDIVRLGANAIKEFKDDIPSMFHGPIDTIIEKLVDSPLDDVRLAPSIMPNFVRDITGVPFAEHKRLSLVDAGIDFNLPLPPLLRSARDIDVIIIYDSSAGGDIGCDLRYAAAYAQRKGIKFPPIPESLGKELCTIMQDPHDATCPTIIYMPRIKNEAYSTAFDPDNCIDNQYCSTFNFKYSQENINELSGLAEFSCHQYIDTIKKVIAERYARK